MRSIGRGGMSGDVLRLGYCIVDASKLPAPAAARPVPSHEGEGGE
jgi:hypothetical protein